MQMTGWIIAFLSCTVLLGESARGSTTKKDASTAVAAIRVQQETERGEKIISGGAVKDVLGDPYLVSALYYSDMYFRKQRRAKGPQNELVVALASLVEKDFREKYMANLEGLVAASKDHPSEALQRAMVAPIDHYSFGDCRRSCHTDAIDLFTEEGSLVKTMVRGVVVLAQEGWQTGRPLSVSSPKGGNEVIVFDPETKRFYRYCHLDKVLVHPGDIIPAGGAIGTVGHTGLNASRAGHGQHLHLEVNWYDSAKGVTHPLLRKQLIDLLKLKG